jgi:hypothetical protein
MNSNEKEKIILNVVKKRFPFVYDIKTVNRQLGMINDIVVVVLCDLEEIQKLYPNEKLDMEYIEDMMSISGSKIQLSSPYEVFTTMPEGGQQIRELILTLVNTVGIESSNIRFTFYV